MGGENDKGVGLGGEGKTEGQKPFHLIFVTLEIHSTKGPS